MKHLLRIVFFSLLLFGALPGFSQVVVLSDAVEFSGKIGTSQRKTLLIQNESDEVKHYTLKFLRGNIGSSQQLKLCIGETCYNPTRDLAKVKLTLRPGELFTEMYLAFDLGITETKGYFSMQFVSTENIREVFNIEATYDVYDPNAEGNAFTHPDIRMGNIYPNPSNQIATIDYELLNPSAQASIALTSFIGNPVATYTLDPMRESLVLNTSDLKPGVYFYTLYVNNKNIVTKKLFVKR